MKPVELEKCSELQMEVCDAGTTCALYVGGLVHHPVGWGSSRRRDWAGPDCEMAVKSKIRRQRPMKGGRRDIWGAIDPALRAWAEREAARDNCTLSLIVNSSMSYASGIPLDDGKKKTATPWNIKRARPLRLLKLA